MTRERYSEGFKRLRDIVEKICFWIAITAIGFRFIYLGDYHPYSRWPEVQFYRDDVVLLFLSITIGIQIFENICTFPITAVEYVLAGFIQLEDHLSESARNLWDFYQNGTRRIGRIASLAAWVTFLLLLWIYSDSYQVRDFVSDRPLFGSSAASGYVIALSLFLLLRFSTFLLQSIAFVMIEQWLHRQYGDEVVDEVGLEPRRRAQALPTKNFIDRALRAHLHP